MFMVMMMMMIYNAFACNAYEDHNRRSSRMPNRSNTGTEKLSVDAGTS